MNIYIYSKRSVHRNKKRRVLGVGSGKEVLNPLMGNQIFANTGIYYFFVNRCNCANFLNMFLMSNYDFHPS